MDFVKKRINLTATADDGRLTGLITAAREFAERITNRCLAPRQLIDYRDGLPYPGRELLIPLPPLVSLDLVEVLEDDYVTWTPWDSSQYWVALYNQPAILQPRRGFTYPTTLERIAGCVRITFTAGHATVVNSVLTPEPLPQSWQENLADIVTFQYENVGVRVPPELVTIPKIHYF
ncbi:MAG TPA: hypothetical protein VFB43_17865 [Terracidiphilus sp.]|nr:hypothetical protein [Terracidiphilus sp.]